MSYWEFVWKRGHGKMIAMLYAATCLFYAADPKAWVVQLAFLPVAALSFWMNYRSWRRL